MDAVGVAVGVGVGVAVVVAVVVGVVVNMSETHNYCDAPNGPCIRQDTIDALEEKIFEAAKAFEEILRLAAKGYRAAYSWDDDLAHEARRALMMLKGKEIEPRKKDLL